MKRKASFHLIPIVLKRKYPPLDQSKVDEYQAFFKKVVFSFVFLIKTLCNQHFGLSFNDQTIDILVHHLILYCPLIDPHNTFRSSIYLRIRDFWHFKKLFRFAKSVLTFFKARPFYYLQDILIHSTSSVLAHLITPVLVEFLYFFNHICIPYHLYQRLAIPYPWEAVPMLSKLAFLKEKGFITQAVFIFFDQIVQLTWNLERICYRLLSNPVKVFFVRNWEYLPDQENELFFLLSDHKVHSPFSTEPWYFSSPYSLKFGVCFDRNYIPDFGTVRSSANFSFVDLTQEWDFDHTPYHGYTLPMEEFDDFYLD